MAKKRTVEEWLSLMKEKHGDKYSYAKTNIVNSDTKVIITCPIHGDFEQTPRNHCKGQGCPICAYEQKGLSKRRSLSSLITEAIKVHGNLYDYTKTEQPVNNKQKVSIICRRCGNEFQQSFNQHLRGEGCPICNAKEGQLARRMSQEEWIERATKKHNGKYDYSRAIYQGKDSIVEIGCPIHGYYKQKAGAHLMYGCNKCAQEIRNASQRHTTQSWIDKAVLVHNHKYDYSLSRYRSAKQKIDIKCQQCGLIFSQIAADHVNLGHGCPHCGHVLSYKEIAVRLFIESLGVKTISNFRPSGNFELDIFCPDYSCGFEFDGLRFHSTIYKTDPLYHQKKDAFFKDKGIHVYHIYEDIWDDSQFLIKKYIKHVLKLQSIIDKPKELELKEMKGYITVANNIYPNSQGPFVAIISPKNEMLCMFHIDQDKKMIYDFIPNLSFNFSDEWYYQTVIETLSSNYSGYTLNIDMSLFDVTPYLEYVSSYHYNSPTKYFIDSNGNKRITDDEGVYLYDSGSCSLIL